MNRSDFTTRTVVDKTPEQAFNAINNVRGWWSRNIEGNTDRPGGEFYYSYGQNHRCKMKVSELIPGQRVVWEVEDNYFDFTEDKTEWHGNRIIFDIRPKGDRTEIIFTQEGLDSGEECFEACSKAWTGYIGKSLFNLITTGSGNPNPKEDGPVWKK